jgi:flagellar hook-basal body complex protein FliE
MSDIRITDAVGPAPIVGPTRPGQAREAGFGESLRQALRSVNAEQQEADRAAQAFSTGQTRDVAGTLIALEKANLKFQLAIQIRNKLLEAYQEISRMPM